MQPFLAMITPVSGNGGGGGQPPSIWNPVFPTNPIAGMGPGGNFPPLGIWGGGGVGNYPDAGFPGPQPGRPPQIWGGPYFPPSIWNPVFPGMGLPGPQPIPGWGPGFPTNPIVIPVPPNTPGAPPEGGMVAVIPAGTTIVSTQEIEIPNPMDPENPYKIPAGTAIVTSQAILVPTGYAPPGAQPPVATPQKPK